VVFLKNQNISNAFETKFENGFEIKEKENKKERKLSISLILAKGPNLLPPYMWPALAHLHRIDPSDQSPAPFSSPTARVENCTNIF